jgi:hypothetical protein
MARRRRTLVVKLALISLGDTTAAFSHSFRASLHHLGNTRRGMRDD